jgi:protein-disulfide isomerase
MERRRRMVQLGALATLAAAIVVAALIALSQSGSDEPGGGEASSESAQLVDAQLRGLPQRGVALGEADAPVRVVEFGDLQCPVCRDFAEQVLPRLIDQEVRDGEVELEFENFTIIGPQSTDAALAALAAGEQGRYWSFIELFYRNQGAENSGYVTDSFLESIAEGAGVDDLDRWNADRSSAALQRRLAAVQDEAARLGLNSTPTFLVEGPNGRRVIVAPSLEQLRESIAAVSS